ncbi:MAG: HlyD family efflux transporter periplasmic adaptor subunit [Synechococcales cyanobacterium C42_A2020_086]|jgi:HlyD family secretion protein|nr:HlyD family efflux transporter periplasmic adaptor subunit [Synechococcales cyanobacterium C42_A2020_086]
MTPVSEPPLPDGGIAPLAAKRSPRRFLLPLGILVLLAAVVWYFTSRPQSGDLEFSGRIEGYETDVGTKAAGRIETVTVREGAVVQRGQLLAKLDDDQVQAQLQGAEARLKAVRQSAENARLQINVLQSQLAEAQVRLRQSQGDAAGRVSQAEAQVAAAEAQLAQAQAQVVEAQSQLDLATVDRDRFTQLARQGAAAQQRADQAKAAYQSALAILQSRQSAVAAAEKQIAAARGGLTQSQSTRLNPDINTAEVQRLRTQLLQAQAQLRAAEAEVMNAVAERDRIASQVNDLTVNSPIDGVVITRSVEPGAVVPTGRVLLTILDLNTVYMRAFIPEGDIGKVRVGQPAQVYLDSAPDQPLAARVAAIDTEASFTPENVYFKDDRVQQVFGVKLTLENPDGFAKPGMPADGEILLTSE